jgi:hypothetical protein
MRERSRNLVLREQVWPIQAGALNSLILTPLCNFGVIATQENLGHFKPTPQRRFGVNRTLEKLCHLARSEGIVRK